MRMALLALLCLFAAVVSAQDAKVDRTGESPVEAKFAPGGRIHMDICSGGIDLVGVSTSPWCGSPIIRRAATSGCKST